VKHLAIALLACALLTAQGALAAAPPPQAAPLEDTVVWYGTPGTRAYVQPALDVWQKLHPNTAINVVEGNGPDILERVNTEARAGHPVADLITFGDLTMWELAAANGLGTYAPNLMPNMRYLIPRIKNLVDAKHRFVPTYLILFGMTVNTNLLAPAQQPNRWTDLLDAKYAGQIGMHDIGVLGAGLTLVMVGRATLGDSFYQTLLNKQRPRVFGRAPELDAAVQSGGRAVVFPAQFANVFRAKGAPVRWIAPKDGVMFVPIYTGIIKNATHPRAAQAFMNFLLDREAQAAIAAAGYIPVTSLAKPPLDLAAMKFLGTGAITEDQALHIDDWLTIGQRLKGE
jgi:iron(III) transport system substrate-binding protein